MTHPDYNSPSYLIGYFQYSHLPDHLQEISKPFGELAQFIDEATASDNPEKEVALRKLLEAKDSAVRASLL